MIHPLQALAIEVCKKVNKNLKKETEIRADGG
jgi:hypothetical protein